MSGGRSPLEQCSGGSTKPKALVAGAVTLLGAPVKYLMVRHELPCTSMHHHEILHGALHAPP